MSAYKKVPEDAIDEDRFTKKMGAANFLSLPENDSPGDSESDAGAEFDLGLGFYPETKKARSPSENENQSEKEYLEENEMGLNESSTVVDSCQPAPWMDRDSLTSTH